MGVSLTKPCAQTPFKRVEGAGRFMAWPVGLDKRAAGTEEARRQARDGT